MNGDPCHRDITYAEIAFDDFVRRRQGREEIDLPASSEDFELQPTDRRLIREADSFFLSTVTGAGWPYAQHRGGPAGFVHLIGPTTIAWGELQGNNQFVTTGNVDRDGRVALFFIDYPTRTRLKAFGYARIIGADDAPELLAEIRDVGEREIRARIDRIMVVDIVATDRNCTKQIRPRWTKPQVDERIDLYRADITALKDERDELAATNEQLRAELAQLRAQRS